MALRTVVEKGDDILRKKCREVGEVTDRIRETLDDMVETMIHYQGVGLAAPQVGIMRRMFVAMPDPEEETVYKMINPRILEQDGTTEEAEACLSVPGLAGIVERPQHIKVEAMDIDGKVQEYEFTDFQARVICHEMDHLDGILYTDKASEVFQPEEEDQEEDLQEGDAAQ